MTRARELVAVACAGEAIMTANGSHGGGHQKRANFSEKVVNNTHAMHAVDVGVNISVAATHSTALASLATSLARRYHNPT